MQNNRCRTAQSLSRTSHCKNMNSCIGKGVWNLDTVAIKPSHHSGCCCNKCRRRKLTPLSSAPTILFSWIYLRYYLDHTSLLFFDHWKKLPFPSILNNSTILLIDSFFRLGASNFSRYFDDVSRLLLHDHDQHQDHHHHQHHH